MARALHLKQLRLLYQNPYLQCNTIHALGIVDFINRYGLNRNHENNLHVDASCTKNEFLSSNTFVPRHDSHTLLAERWLDCRVENTIAFDIRSAKQWIMIAIDRRKNMNQIKQYSYTQQHVLLYADSFLQNIFHSCSPFSYFIAFFPRENTVLLSSLLVPYIGFLIIYCQPLGFSGIPSDVRRRDN